MGQTMSIPLEVRFRDVDMLGHVNNAVYLTYFEEGRKKFFYDHMRERDDEGFNFILARAECDYKIALTLESRPVLTLWIGRVGSKSFTFCYRIAEEGLPDRVYAEGATAMVAYDYAAKRSVPVRPSLRASLERFLP